MEQDRRVDDLLEGELEAPTPEIATLVLELRTLKSSLKQGFEALNQCKRKAVAIEEEILRCEGAAKKTVSYIHLFWPKVPTEP